jgi:hypothetical protein
MTNWIPFRIACRLRSLQQGSLNVGNTRQNLANLATLAIANALTNGGRGDWARFRIGFGPLGGTLGNSTTTTAGLLINVPAVPGYVAPFGSAPSLGTGSRVLDEAGNFVSDEAGNRVLNG